VTKKLNKIPHYAMNNTVKISWKEELSEIVPLLGHRNWIVVTDMAYPLQTQPGIKTFHTGEACIDVLEYVFNNIEQEPHIKANIYQDMELQFVENADTNGIDRLREQMRQLMGEKVTHIPHEMLISRLDEAARMFNVVVLKTTLTIPYTSTFFELDCNYWNAEKEERLQKKIQYP
jgi:D-ribose pyranose/furanose isomerase RbsD